MTTTSTKLSQRLLAALSDALAWRQDISAPRLARELLDEFGKEIEALEQPQVAKAGLSDEEIERMLVDIETVLCESMEGRPKSERMAEVDRYRICIAQLARMGFVRTRPNERTVEHDDRIGSISALVLDHFSDLPEDDAWDLAVAIDAEFLQPPVALAARSEVVSLVAAGDAMRDAMSAQSVYDRSEGRDRFAERGDRLVSAWDAARSLWNHEPKR